MVVCFQVSSNVVTRRFADLTLFPVARTCCVSMRVDRVRALRRKRGKSWFWYSRHRNWNTMFSWVMLVTSPVKKASAHAHSWTRKEYLLFWLSEVSFTRCNFLHETGGYENVPLSAAKLLFNIVKIETDFFASVCTLQALRSYRWDRESSNKNLPIITLEDRLCSSRASELSLQDLLIINWTTTVTNHNINNL